jgi:tRNA threonylcarbamoyl adenosine modification protein (Sua5/YciO/YrdC/YwlC family)
VSAERLKLHAETPQRRFIERAARVLNDHGVIVMPTDTCYAFAIAPGSRQALERLARIKQIDTGRHLFSLIVPDLSEIARFAEVDTRTYRILKRFLPGSYTFVLKATREVPRLLLERRKTIGLRVPDHPVALALARESGGAVLASTVKFAGDELPLADPDEIVERCAKRVDLILESGWGGVEPSSVIDLSEGDSRVIRSGAGAITSFELD